MRRIREPTYNRVINHHGKVVYEGYDVERALRIWAAWVRVTFKRLDKRGEAL